MSDDPKKHILHLIERYSSARCHEELAGQRDSMTAVARNHSAAKKAWDEIGEALDGMMAASDGHAAAQAEVVRLTSLINTPRTDEFFEAVRIEAAHQIERWGAEHDAGKRSEDWVTLFVYLLGKAARAHFDGDQPKLEHHVITSAAVALNWWRHLTGVSTAMRPGIADPAGHNPGHNSPAPAAPDAPRCPECDGPADHCPECGVPEFREHAPWCSRMDGGKAR